MVLGHLEINGFTVMNGITFKGGFERSKFSIFDFVGLGHFHYRQTDGNISYFGSPYQMTWGDYGNSKGFHILDTETKLFEFVANPREIYKQIIYTDETKPEDVNEQIVKVILKDAIDERRYELFLEKMEETRPYIIETVDKREMTLEENKEIEDIEDTKSIILQYIDSLQKEGLDRDRVRQFFDELYTEALMIQ